MRLELATRNAKEQAYTKVPDYVELMGNTGVMINLSLVPTATFDGTLKYDGVEGMNYDKAIELRKKYPATAGTICIGIDNIQIKLLLADGEIDYVIPYHKSGMAAAIRKLMHIPSWTQYEDYQHEIKLSRPDAERQAKQYGVKLLSAEDPNYQKEPKFSEWFDITEAKQVAELENSAPTDTDSLKKYGIMYGGYMAMRNAANNYLRLCAERGLSPKFSHPKADFTKEANYWKLLIDRKMINNVTGEIIEQQSIKPVFYEKEVLRILNDELERYPNIKRDQEYAIRTVTEAFLSGKVKSGMTAERIAEALKAPVDNITTTNIIASARDDGIHRSQKSNGNVIPLSERFDIYKRDIRYSKKAEGDAVEVSEGDVEQIKKSAKYQNEYSRMAELAKEYGITISASEIQNNAVTVTQMDKVSSLTGAEFEADGKTSLAQKIIEFFNSFQNRVETKEIGTVSVVRSSFSDDRGHGLTRNKIVSFKAIPEVLKKGLVIDVYKPNGKPYIRITLAAPIYIGAEKYYMGVMVQKDNQSNRMYLHDVITEKATSSFSNGANHQNGEGIRDEGHLFITSVLQKALNVKGNIKKSQKASPSTDDRITISRGELAKLKANYEGEKQFNKKDIQNALGKVEALKVLSRKEKNELVTKLFQGYNIRLDSEGYERFSELMYHKIHARILQESDFELSAEELRSADEQIVNALREIVDTGHDSIKTKLEQSVSQDGLKKQADYWKNEHKRATEQIKIKGQIYSRLQQIKNIKTGAYENAALYKGKTFVFPIRELLNIEWRGNINNHSDNVRKHLRALNEWYNALENPIYSSIVDTDGKQSMVGRFNNDVKQMLEKVSKESGKLTTNDLLYIEKIVSYFVGEMRDYNTIIRNGKRVEAAPLAEEYIDKAKKAREINLKCGAVRMLARNRFAVMVADPATLMRQADGYLNGFFTEMFEEMRQGEITSAVREMELTEEFREFWDKTKSYRKRYNQAKINVNGTDISLGYAISLYMTYKRRHAQAGLVLSGFDILDGDKKITVYKDTDEKLSQKDISRIAKERADELYSQFNENDKKLISIMEGALEECRKLKIDVDMALQHYTNVDNTDYYFPIRRSQIAQNVDMFSMFEGDRVSNLSMNKDTVKGAKNALLIEPAHLVFMRHIKATSLYSGLGIFTDNFNRLYNLNVNGISENTSKSNAEKIINHNRPETIKSTLESDKFPKAMMEYFTEIKKDIEGISTKNQSTSFFNDAVRFIRSNYAKYQLGANPKVWFTQLSSFFAASNILDYSSIVKGFGVKNKKADVDEYCKLAWLRNADDTAANAQAVADKPKAVTDKTAKLSNLLMTPIGMVDRFVVVNLFGACQAQIEKTEGLAIGSKANKVKAGELLERVILETQQNSLASERSAAMRTDNDLLKSSTMFSADAMKGTARMLDAFGEREVLRTLIKKESDPKAKSEHESRLKEVNKNCAKSIAAVTMVSVFTALIARAIKSWYRRDDEEDTETFIADVIGNMLGGIPIIRDFYSFFADGYEMDNFMMSTFNDVLTASLNSFTVFKNAISGKPVSEQEIASAVKKSIFAAGQVSGIPVRNAYNFVTGNINRFLPSTGYKIDNLFYKQSYKADLAKAIENEDEDMIATITGLMLDENIGEIEDSASRKELNRLITAEYDVLPRSVNDTVTYQGESYTLNAKEKKAFKKVYGIANESLAKMVKSTLYREATDEVKAKAIKYIYDTYYNLALQDYLGEDIESKNILFAEAIDIEKLALIIATARSIVADTDKNGKTIAGSKKRKIQAYISSLRLSAAEKYMCMGYLGYTNVNGETQVKAHINKLKLSANEKKKLLEYSGYVA